MASITKGILGPFKGTVGTVVGSNWRGIDYMRSKSGKRTGLPSPAQLDQQAKFSAMRKLLQSMKAVMEIGFSHSGNQQTPINSALSYNLKNAISGNYPDPTIQFNMLLVSKGDLPSASNPQAIAAAGKVHFTWVNNAGMGKALDDDNAVLTVYCAETNQTIYSLAGAARKDAAADLNTPELSGKKVETYLSFVSANGKEIANSVYTGQITVL